MRKAQLESGRLFLVRGTHAQRHCTRPAIADWAHTAWPGNHQPAAPIMKLGGGRGWPCALGCPAPHRPGYQHKEAHHAHTPQFPGTPATGPDRSGRRGPSPSASRSVCRCRSLPLMRPQHPTGVGQSVGGAVGPRVAPPAPGLAGRCPGVPRRAPGIWRRGPTAP